MPEYRPQFPERRPDDEISLGVVSESQTTLLDYYPMYHHGKNGDHTPKGHMSRAAWVPPGNQVFVDANPFLRFHGLDMDSEQWSLLDRLENNSEQDSLVANLPNLAAVNNPEEEDANMQSDENEDI